MQAVYPDCTYCVYVEPTARYWLSNLISIQVPIIHQTFSKLKTQRFFQKQLPNMASLPHYLVTTATVLIERPKKSQSLLVKYRDSRSWALFQIMGSILDVAYMQYMSSNSKQSNSFEELYIFLPQWNSYDLKKNSIIIHM